MRARLALLAPFCTRELSLLYGLRRRLRSRRCGPRAARALIASVAAYFVFACGFAVACTLDADCDDGDACTIPDTCQGGVCVAGGGGDGDGDAICDANDNCPGVANAGQDDLDADDIGDVCDANDRLLNVVAAKLKKKPSPALVRGAITAKGDFLATPPEATFSGSSGFAIRVQESQGLDLTFVWTPAECETKPSGRISCQSADKARKASFKPFIGVTGQIKYKIRIIRLDIAGPFFEPVTLTITNQPAALTEGIDRVGQIIDCKQTLRGMTCRE